MGVLQDVEYIFGLHVMPDKPTQTLSLKEGMFSASSDNFDIVITGKGGLGSMPHLCIDPIVIGAEIVSALQQIVARKLDPLHAPVLTIATLQSGIIMLLPARLRAKLSMRISLLKRCTR